MKWKEALNLLIGGKLIAREGWDGGYRISRFRTGSSDFIMRSPGDVYTKWLPTYDDIHNGVWREVDGQA